jgi:hypothetical protein
MFSSFIRPFVAKKASCGVLFGRETILNKICRKIGNKGGIVKDILYVAKERAATHYIWLTAFFNVAIKNQ